MEDKKIISTVLLIIFFAFVCFLCWLAVDMLVYIKGYNPDLSGYTEGMDGEAIIVMAAFFGLALAAPYILIFLSSILIILNSLICLGFAIRNMRIEYRPVKIINIVLTCCFAAASILGIVAIILLRVL